VLPFELHPETPPEGAPKPFPPEAWPAVRARLERFANEVGLPIDPPQRNVNSRFALETAELIRDVAGDDASGAFHQAVSTAFFTRQADISRAETLIPLAEPFGVSATEIETAWGERRYSARVDQSMRDAQRAGVSGVPAMGWPQRPAVVGMRPPADLIAMLRN